MGESGNNQEGKNGIQCDSLYYDIYIYIYTRTHTPQSQKTNKKMKKQHEESTDKIPICLHQELDYTPHERQHTRSILLFVPKITTRHNIRHIVFYSLFEINTIVHAKRRE